MKILVVDDQADICEFLTDLLEVHSCEVLTAGSGEEALDLCEGVSFDAAFLDICLPGIDGVQTMIRLMKNNPDSKYILMTGACVEDRVEEGLASGAVTCFQKPFDIMDVLMVLGINPRNIKN